MRTASGRPVSVEVTVPSVGLDHGYRFRVLGDEIRLSGTFGFTGEPTGRPPLPEEAATVRRHVGPVERAASIWTEAHREEARRLQAEGLSWAQVAERVCGDKRFKSTVQRWLRAAACAISAHPLAVAVSGALEQLQVVGDLHARPAVPGPDDDRERTEDSVDGAPLEAELAQIGAGEQRVGVTQPLRKRVCPQCTYPPLLL